MPSSSSMIRRFLSHAMRTPDGVVRSYQTPNTFFRILSSSERTAPVSRRKRFENNKLQTPCFFPSFESLDRTEAEYVDIRQGRIDAIFRLLKPVEKLISPGRILSPGDP